MTASVETIQDTLNRVELLCQDIAGNLVIKPTQIIIYEGLSDISGNLGLAIAGEFRTGVGTPGRGFSGLRIAYPGMLYGTETWHLAGVNNDVLQVGINASTGRLYAGAGDVTIDANGIDFKMHSSAYVSQNSIEYIDALTTSIAQAIQAQTFVPALGNPITYFSIEQKPLANREGAMFFVGTGITTSQVELWADNRTTVAPVKIQLNSSSVYGAHLSFEADVVTYTAHDIYLDVTGASPKVWHQGNDGPGSGLNADMVDGAHFSNTSWSPTPTGFSAVPGNAVYTYELVGKVCTLFVRQGADGTSNATTFTIPLPFTAKTVTSGAWSAPAQVVAGGVLQATPGFVRILTGATVVDVYKDYAVTAFANDGLGKRANFQITYEIE